MSNQCTDRHGDYRTRIPHWHKVPRVDVPAAMGDTTDPALLHHVRSQLAEISGEQEPPSVTTESTTP
jgi:hypothetical protein